MTYFEIKRKKSFLERYLTKTPFRTKDKTSFVALVVTDTTLTDFRENSI